MLRIIIADPDSTNRKALTLLLQRKFDMGGIVQVGDVEMLIRACYLPPSPKGLPTPENCSPQC